MTRACARRTEKRDARREVKALKAAKVETAIEAELLARLKQGTYGDIYNFDQKVYERVLQAAEVGPCPPTAASVAQHARRRQRQPGACA